MREQWKSFEEFHTSVVANREIIDSIIEGYVEKYRLDATTHPVRLPDLLLRECEHEIQRVSDSCFLHLYYTAPAIKFCYF